MEDGAALDARERLTVGLRAEELRLEPEPAVGRAAVRVVSVLPTRAVWYYRSALGDDIVTVRDERHPGLREGGEVLLVALPKPLEVFDGGGRSRTAPSGREAPAEADAGALPPGRAPASCRTGSLAGEGREARA